MGVSSGLSCSAFQHEWITCHPNIESAPRSYCLLSTETVGTELRVIVDVWESQLIGWMTLRSGTGLLVSKVSADPASIFVHFPSDRWDTCVRASG